MPKPKDQSLLFSSCSLLMASLFAYSALVQLDDPDWYFWLPLYSLASAVNLLSSIRFASTHLDKVAKLVLWSGLLLLLKVVIEDRAYEIAGFWSLDMEERVVREKLGSGLVVISMFLQLHKSVDSEDPRGGRRGARCAEYGIAMLVAMTMGLISYFFAVVKEIRR